MSLQRKRRESASSSSSVKKVKKPWGTGGVCSQPRCPQVWGPRGPKRAGQLNAPPTTAVLFPTNEYPTPPHLRLASFVTKATTEWHFIPLRPDSPPPPSLDSDEARSTVNCQAELIRTQGRRWKWAGNWNELERENRLRLDNPPSLWACSRGFCRPIMPQCLLEMCFCAFVFSAGCSLPSHSGVSCLFLLPVLHVPLVGEISGVFFLYSGDPEDDYVNIIKLIVLVFAIHIHPFAFPGSIALSDGILTCRWLALNICLLRKL